MPLPKINTPVYELVLPSSGRKVKYRPFLVREEKILIMALESENQKQISEAIKTVIGQCVQTKGIKVVERKIRTEEMKNFVGCFLTGTAAEVTPVSQIGKFQFKVCEMIKDLSESYQNLVRKKSAA